MVTKKPRSESAELCCLGKHFRRSFITVEDSSLCKNYKKLSYCWETARRESKTKIAEMEVEMTTAEMTFKCPSSSSKVAPIES